MTNYIIQPPANTQSSWTTAIRHLLWLLLPFTFSCYEQAPAAPASGERHVPVMSSALSPQNAALVQRYERYFRDEISRTNTVGAGLVIVADGKVALCRGFGRRQYGRSDTVDAHTVFRIGSLSKGFTGILSGMMVQRGAFRWEDPVRAFCPDFRLRDARQASRIRVWHLLSHTTGLPYHAFTNLVEEGYSLKKIMTEYFPKAPISGREGAFFAYQNAAFSVVEEVIEKTTGKTYGQQLQESIFKPLGMSDASSDFASIHQNSNVALPHFSTGAGWRADSISEMYYNTAAAGGINASISDMGQWLLLLLGQRPDLIADTTLNHVFKPVVKTGNERRILPGWIARDEASYAMGWRVLEHKDDIIIYHGGYVNGYKSEIAIDRRRGIGVCALFNAHTELSSRCVPAFFDLWAEKQ
ncbi:MAG: beta-lactamase family protein [Saprospiraceae bacterium]|nr:beta-lactamase family protein [Saprospiraceae bacterium]